MFRTNLNDVLVFMSVVDGGSFIGGGQAMGLTRSAVGKAIGRLEERLGVRLFNRTTRALSLTDEGRVFYEHGLQVVAAIQEAESSVSTPQGKPRGLLRLTVPDAYGKSVLLPIIRSYLEQWPDVQVEVSFTDRQADIIEEGFDAAVRIGSSAADSRLVSRVIATYAAVLCASPEYLLKCGTPIKLEDLDHHDCLVFTSNQKRQHWRFRMEGGESVKVTGRSRLRLDSGQAIRTAAIDGLGIAYLPSFLVANDLSQGRLVQVLNETEADKVIVSIIYPTRRFLEPRVRHFIDLLIKSLP
jgi:DNA-binding transcriptional LysR family regulator